MEDLPTYTPAEELTAEQDRSIDSATGGGSVQDSMGQPWLITIPLILLFVAVFVLILKRRKR